MNKLFITLALFSVLFFASTLVTESKVASGTFKSKDSWAFLNKFCFGTKGPGLMQLTSKSNNPNIEYYLYDDVEGSWGSVYKSKDSCWDKANNTQFYGPIPNDGSTLTLPFQDIMRPHYWFLAVADCTGGELEFDYTLEFYNYGGIWYKQFSWDETGLEQLYLVYFFVFLILLGYSLYSAWTLISTKSFHPIVKLLTLTIILEFLSVFILLIHYGAYSHDGVGAKGLLGFGELLDLAAQLTMILLLILVAKGWAISRVTIDEKRVIFGVMGGLSVLYLVMFIWYKAGQDPASTTYMYDTVPGILLLIARSIAMVWFMWCGYNTYMEETHPAKRKFYVYFGGAFVAWFISLPFICIVAAAVDPWIRLKTVLAFYVTFNAIGLTVLQVLLSPARANDYFTISGRVDGAGSYPYESI